MAGTFDEIIAQILALARGGKSGLRTHMNEYQDQQPVEPMTEDQEYATQQRRALDAMREQEDSDVPADYEFEQQQPLPTLEEQRRKWNKLHGRK